MGSRDQARPWFSLNLREFIEALIYTRLGFDWAGMSEFFFLTLRELVEEIIYPRHGSKGLGMAKVLFTP